MLTLIGERFHNAYFKRNHYHRWMPGRLFSSNRNVWLSSDVDISSQHEGRRLNTYRRHKDNKKVNTYGYVCFAYTDVWYDWCIAKVSGSQWSHAFITIPPIVGREMVLEAVHSGVSASPFDREYKGNPKVKYEVYRFNGNPSKIDSAISKCMNRLETSYGFLEYIFLLWRFINGWFGRDIRSHNNWCQQGTICSGLVRTFIEESGFDLFSKFGKDAVTPGDVYAIVKAHPELFQLVECQS
jgi:hypothetical protein